MILLGWLLPFFAVAQDIDTPAPGKLPTRSLMKEPMPINTPGNRPVSTPVNTPVSAPAKVEANPAVVVNADSVMHAQNDSVAKALQKEFDHITDSLQRDSAFVAEYGRVRNFNPDPNRAMWLSLLCPGLGQVYNRRYWKLPIVVGGFVGFGYATSWNNKMLQDYTKAYRDAMDSDPNTRSYMDFYPPNYSEDNIDMEWLKKTLKSKKDFYRRNKEICVIGIVGMYMLCVLDAYVDASLMHFDISDDISMQVKPAVVNPYNATQGRLPSVGVQCAFSF